MCECVYVFKCSALLRPGWSGGGQAAAGAGALLASSLVLVRRTCCETDFALLPPALVA